MRNKLLFTTLSVGAVVAGAIVLSSKTFPPGLYPPQGGGVANPAITQANIQENICNKNWSTKSIRPPSSYTSALKKAQLMNSITQDSSGKIVAKSNSMAIAGDTDLSHYEEDHIISLELGGAPSDPKNLWPQQYTLKVNGENLGAREKDRAEGYLNRKVCDGSMTLKEAQDEISTDWVTVYHTLKASKNLGSITEEVSTSDDGE